MHGPPPQPTPHGTAAPRRTDLPACPVRLVADRPSRPVPLVLVALLALLVAAPAALRAQIRPLDPLDWGALEHEGRSLEMGGGIYTGQRASLAGTEGRLLELGAFAASWGFGRVAVRLAGTAVRVFSDQDFFADPVGGARAFREGRRRTDTGDYRLSTLVSFTAPGADLGAAVRFGVRLPTTDNVEGLGRDQTDFFSSVSGRARGESVAVSAEVGVGINGTRDLSNEQVDPLLFALAVRRTTGQARPFLELVGQHDTRAGPEPRGTENLGEARLGVRVGNGRWLRIAGIRGWTRMGPELGLEIRMGSRF